MGNAGAGESMRGVERRGRKKWPRQRASAKRGPVQMNHVVGVDEWKLLDNRPGCAGTALVREVWRQSGSYRSFHQ